MIATVAKYTVKNQKLKLKYQMLLQQRYLSLHRTMIETTTTTSSEALRTSSSSFFHHQPHHHRRQYSHTTRLSLASDSWWNPFSFGSTGTSSGSLRDNQAKVTSSSQGSTSELLRDPEKVWIESRKLQERKDAIIAILTSEYRRISMDNENNNDDDKDYEEVKKLALESLDGKELDDKTLLQIRHELQTSFHDQVVELFHAFATVDTIFTPNSIDDPDDGQLNVLYDQLLLVEWERTMDQLANPTPPKARKGQSPNQFLELKRSAIELLMDRRQKIKKRKEDENNNDDGSDDSTSTSTATTSFVGGLNSNDEKISATDNSSSSSSSRTGGKGVSWVDADPFGYHETIDQERDEYIRHYQTVNICRSSKFQDEWGFSVIALQSSIPGAGRGVYVDGHAKAGSILCFQPGDVWAKEHMLNLPADIERQLEKNDHYQMSLRPDDYMIDSRKSPYTVLTGPRTNLMSLGHIINHPTPSKPPNCLCIMINFTPTMDLGPLQRYIPNTYIRPRNLTLTGSLWEREVIDMHGMCVIATRDVCNEELFYDYRLMTHHLPSWYHRMEDKFFKDDVEEEEQEMEDQDEAIEGKKETTMKE